MTKYAIAIGTLLIVQGVGSYALLAASGDGSPSVTALIPAFAGIPILFLGMLALKESFRKHAMHAVAVLSLVGFLLPAGRLAMQLVRGTAVKTTIAGSLVLMAILCGTLLALCVKSFIDAHRKE